MRRKLLHLFLSAVFWSASVEAQEPGRGPIFPVNAYTTSQQGAPDVAPNPDGSFVIVWESAGQEPGTGVNVGVYARRFDSLGNPLADEFLVNEYTLGDQIFPRVAADTSGNFVVVWQGQSLTDATGINGRLFTANGTPTGPEFTVHPPTPADSEQNPAVARSDTAYVVAWQTYVTGASNEILGMFFTGGSRPQGGPFPINTYTTGGQSDPEIAMDASGSFLVTWASAAAAGGAEIRGRAFDATGAPLGPDFQVNTYTTGYQLNHSVAPDGAGGFVVCWNDNNLGYPLRGQRYDNAGNPSGSERLLGRGSVPRIHRRALGGFAISYGANGIFASRYDDSLNLLGVEFQLNDVLTGGTPGTPIAVTDTGRHLVFTWADFAGNSNVVARRGGYPEWAPFKVDARASGGTSNVNGVIEVGERVMVDQAYLNLSGAPYPLAGTASNWTGPAGLIYTLHDSAADYGAISGSAPTSGGEPPQGSTTADCFTATANCFEFELTGPRLGGVHWDTTYDEALSEDVSVTRTIHVGESFLDVAPTSLFYPFIENLLHNGITGGGACGGYCPADGVKRQQMSVFLLKSKNGNDYVPPFCNGTIFADVPNTNPFACFIEDLYNQGVTGGCATNPLRFCPDNIVNRQQMAVFLLKMKEGSIYDPPDCAGIFQDVTCTPGAGFSDWIEELYNRQITGGCVANPLQYCPTNSVTRGQMSAFLVKNFGLVLYGP